MDDPFGAAMSGLLMATRSTFETMLWPTLVLSLAAALMLRALEDLFLRNLAQRATVIRWVIADRTSYSTLIPELKHTLLPDRAAFSLPPDQLCAQMEALLQTRLSALALADKDLREPADVVGRVMFRVMQARSDGSYDPSGFEVAARLVQDEASRSIDALQSRLAVNATLRAHFISFWLGLLFFVTFSFVALPTAPEGFAIYLFSARALVGTFFGLMVALLAPLFLQTLARLLPDAR